MDDEGLFWLRELMDSRFDFPNSKMVFFPKILDFDIIGFFLGGVFLQKYR